ncbi:hypothetical protein RBQ61_02585 [Sedimentibacter sp. MB35-C1]|uniref:hypothetical protein n=1 Tax=Sedimentibacter sp. MB35-C1 TaxID=3070995 RepID=UPI0027DFA23F|nr:hypothetical protein [Sedimentibacter sp. MB35-C1]WMJ77833.1 hypothetical protein RBQ61_02585 [Sedimentibacter sp. MB35-C1]
MEYLQLQYSYLKNGLEDFNLKSMEDFKNVFNIPPEYIAGYNDLPKDKKQLFGEFLVSYLNRIGLNIKANFVPVSIYYVEEITLGGKVQENDEYYTEYSRQFYILRPDGKKEKMKRKGYRDKDVIYAFTKENKKHFLRFDFLENKKKVWLHVISPTEWY